MNPKNQRMWKFQESEHPKILRIQGISESEESKDFKNPRIRRSDNAKNPRIRKPEHAGKS